jgi:hypothetical protein
MPLTYSPNLKLTLIGDGEQTGTWGQLTNTNLGTLIEQAIAGYTTVSITDANYTLTSINGATDEARSMALNITSSVTLTATRNVICPSVSKLYVVKNATTGGQSIVIKTSAGTGITVANGATAIVLCDGTNVIDPISTKQTALGYTPVNKAGDTMSGGLSFTGSATRIQGDFSNATVANRTAFQDKTTNTATQVNSLPNGSAVGSGFVSYASSDPTNSAYGSIYCDSSSARISSAALGSGTTLPLVFNIGGLEAARLDTSQNFMVGRTSYSFLSNTKGTTLYYTGQVITETDWTHVPFLINSFGAGTADSSVINFYRGGTVAGTIYTQNGNITIYATASDYRLKSNAQPLTGSGAFIDALQPKTWTWTSSGTPGVGFIAHEVAQVAQFSVSGQKDEVDSNGNPKYQNIGYGSSEFIANIVAELKSLRARVAALEAK